MSEVAGRYILIKRPFKKDILSFCRIKKKKNTLNMFIDPTNFECVEGISK